MSVRARGFLLAALLVVVPGAALATQGATKDEAVAMVKKAVAAIKTEGADKAYAEISDPRGPSTATSTGQDRIELLAELQVHEPGEQDDRAERDVLRAADDTVVCGGVYRS